MPTPSLTDEEIIGCLGRTSLPTLLVEGKGDAAIYRWVENELEVFSGNVLPCSGRNTLISISRKRDMFPHGMVVWLADLDMWRFAAPPPDLEGIVFTSAYSIENDLYAGSRIEALLDEDERSRHGRLLGVVCRWFAFEVLECLAGREYQVDHHVRRVVDFDTIEISPQSANERGDSEPDPSRGDAILADYQLGLRGKTLVEVLGILLKEPRRPAKYSHAAIMEMCLRLPVENPYLGRIVLEARRRLT
jgi:hypothetical protein